MTDRRRDMKLWWRAFACHFGSLIVTVVDATADNIDRVLHLLHSKKLQKEEYPLTAVALISVAVQSRGNVQPAPGRYLLLDSGRYRSARSSRVETRSRCSYPPSAQECCRFQIKELMLNAVTSPARGQLSGPVSRIGRHVTLDIVRSRNTVVHNRLRGLPCEDKQMWQA